MATMAEILGPGGVISRRLPGYESRPAQVTMAETVATALQQGRHAIIEGGTGVGKSLAYLIPAIYSGKKVIISTANKALQDQLVGKDIPFLQPAPPREVPAALVRGRSNSLCLDRLDEEERFQTMAGPSPDYRRLKAWAAGTRTGDFEELPTLPARDLQVRVGEALAEIAERLVRQDPFRDAKTPTRESRHYEKLVEWTSRLAEDARLISTVNDEDSVRYVERGAGPRFAEVTAKWTPVDVSEPLAEILFRQTPVICTSATLAVGDFSYFRRAVGITAAAELIAPSPFDYPRQCLLYVPSHLPEFRGAATPEYTAALCAEIERLVRASGGRAFLLFTSYRGLEDAYAALAARLPYTVLRQGEAPRGELLRRFRADGAAVLFGTRSFWEGVDVVGDALSLVVIDRMPFTVPDDPVVSTRVERMKREGQDWFNDLMLPTATLQLKQGVGRLIRSRTDRGVVAILDSRLAHRAYGVRVIRALPPARLVRHIAEVESFFEVHKE